jgi:hypothetical protein
MHALHSFWDDECGQDVVEYSLLLFFVGTVSAALYISLPDAMRPIWENATSKLNLAINSAS